MAHVGQAPLNFDKLQADLLAEQQTAERQGGFSNTSGRTQQTALQRLQLLLRRSADATRREQLPRGLGAPAALGTADPGLHDFAQRQNEDVERMKLQQFLAGKVPSEGTPSIRGLENFGSQLNTEPIPEQGQEQRDLFRRRIAPGRTF